MVLTVMILILILSKDRTLRFHNMEDFMSEEKQKQLPNVSFKVTTETQARILDEQKRLIIQGKAARVSDVSSSRITGKVITWFLDQPESTRDAILA